MWIPALILGAVAALPTAHAADHVVIEYKEGDTVLEGYVASPKGSGKKPAVVIVHEWDGLGDYVKGRAQKIKDLGYVAFGADIYGKGVRAKSPEEASALAKKYRDDRPLLRKRIRAAIDTVRRMDNVDPNQVVVMGYCFGGTTALEAARDDAPVKAAISFHGNLSTPMKAKNMKAKILALHGADDPMVPPAEVEDFRKEMQESKADWQFVAYGNAVHSFTNPATEWKPGMPYGYNAVADRRSWEAMKLFLAETFKK